MKGIEDRARGDVQEADARVYLISLGCPKNLVDSEMILGDLGSHGLRVTPDADDADIVVINTCGFVDSAKEESIDRILEACELKKQSDTPKKVVVTGCLGQRYGAELQQEIPELDAIVGVGDYRGLGATLRGMVGERPKAVRRTHYRVSDPTTACYAEVGRFRLTPRHYAYIRISEGCDNPCTFCAIPAIRGRFRSKPLPIILEEARELVASGAREIILISQDTTSYGVDLDGTFQLPRLLERLGQVEGVQWIRLLYAYPAFLSDEMITAVASIPQVVKYVDMPLQHISDAVLRRMGRSLNEARTRALVENLRQRIPGLYLRTTLLVGFPGETEKDFRTLRDFVREFRFERVGVFPYSREDGTPSASFANQLPEKVKAERVEELMLVQQQIAFQQNRARRGDVVDVLIDELWEGDSGGALGRGRSYGEAPDIDPAVILKASDTRDGHHGDRAAAGESNERPSYSRMGAPRRPSGFEWNTGEFVKARIADSRDYDLLATPVISLKRS